MRSTVQHFLTILTMELEDMKEDLEALTRHCAAQKEQGEISDYVFRENIAVYKNLSSGVGCLMETLQHIACDQYADIPELISELQTICRERLTERGLSGGMARTFRRKMEKVARYLHGDVG